MWPEWSGKGFFGHLDVAIIEVGAIAENGDLLPTTSVGNNKTWIDCADKVILEVNSWQPTELEGFHDIYYGTALPPHRKPIPILTTSDRIGVPHLRCPPEKIIAVVPTDEPDHDNPFKPPDEDSRRIADHVVEFLSHEVERGRLPANLLPLQSGVGNIANAVLAGLDGSGFAAMTAYTGDFARNAYISMFLTPSTVRSGTISCIVPMVSHVDHTEHDVHVVVTERGLADLRGLPPRRRAQRIITACAHPDYQEELQDYFDRATAQSRGKHTPHLFEEVLSWHVRYLREASMSRIRT